MKILKTFLVLASVGAMGFSSCQKDPDWDDLDNKYIVQTEKDSKVDFAKYKTYFVNDTVYVVGGSGNEKTEKWNYKESARARGMIDKVISNMKERGYVRAEKPGDGSFPDYELGIQIVYMQNAYLYYGYGYTSWWDYWGAWNGGWYWGGYYPPYYAFPIIYSYATGSVIVDMIDNKAEEVEVPGEHKPSKPIVWNAYATGQLSTSKKFNQQVVEWSIDQAFEQSPYLQAK